MLKNEVTGNIIILAEERTGAGRSFELETECLKGHFTTDLCDFVVVGHRLKMLPRDGFCHVCRQPAAVCQQDDV